MPPWPPSPECEPLRDARVLAPAEIDAIVAWAAAGAPEGDPPDAPADPLPPDELASIDLTVEPEADYVPRDRPDDYHCFRVDPSLAEDRDVVEYEVVPGTPAEVITARTSRSRSGRLPPHAHARRDASIRVDGVTGGVLWRLADIPDWDFHSQQLYLFETPIDAGAGGTVP